MAVEFTQLALVVGSFLAENALGNIVGTAFEAVGNRLLDVIRTKYPATQRLLGALERDPKNGRNKTVLIEDISKQLSGDEEFRRLITGIVQELLAGGWVLPNLPPPTALHQLPADISDFTGREQELENILGEAGRERTSCGIVLLTGLGGTGKSALAVHAAHLLKEQYPDVQLYVDLRGTDAQPSSPLDVLAGFLRVLRVQEADIPKGLDEREQLYRSILAERKALILLDNARDQIQVKPLLPAGLRCLVLVTSRWSLGEMDGTSLSLEMNTMRTNDAMTLLGHCAGTERVLAEPDAAERIVHLCGYLPLALRIAGSHLKKRPVTLRQYASDLENEDERLALLASGDRAVRANFMLSYQNLSPWEARLFRLLGLLHEGTFSPGAARALDGGKDEHVWKVLEGLVDAQLISVNGTRYGIHDLVRLLAKERLSEEKASAQDAACARLAGWLADKAREMSVWLSPETRSGRITELAQEGIRIEGGGREEFLNALNWFELERGNLVAAVENAHQGKDWELTWQLAINSAIFYNLRSHWTDWERTHVLALDAARRKPDENAEGIVLNLLGNVYRHQGRWEDAAGIFRQSLDLNRRLGNLKGESIALNLLANVYRLQGRWEEAVALFEEALELNTRHDNPHGRAIALGGLANVYRMQGHWEEALDTYTASLALAEAQGDRSGQVINLNMTALVLARLGRLAEAEAALNKGLVLARELKISKGECIALRILGDVHMLRRDWEPAFENLTSSLRIARRQNDKRCMSQALLLLGEWHTQQQNWEEAEACFEEAMSIVRGMDDRHDEGLALRCLALLRFAQDRRQEAASLRERALECLNPGSPEYAELAGQTRKLAADRSSG